ncbi:MAG: TlpA family protein disulfide reductase [Gammaproteobacteria bacterium HGW-Gammaproteobacteria-9]|jgi:thiol-disulfide isomerase/thioredoxin|uniref:Thiol-disulfide isomerase-like thioredoxin n=1 Tax=Stutzerimonas stutzeri RCH2 TaxID=644801 RepID=L0GH39_STUST|nr:MULTISPECIES: TlpA disulfide reductase family protein [Pseudomonadaceae]AGA86038.1 thiol-disulfide isomerase-like thioredoxin [Stutzerimonas stutzeri RCH2]OCX90795.1 MAG: peroxiredoxin [Pseudomonas sp. CO183]PKM00369.1 MAG: TlpA family protein disulfide reductase [Gammaproteobacteria bacterium HGW-Gammaproteobacteria-9]GCA55166.1 thiol-disulfide oxidoreductase ResA [Pseudomonas sp. SCT]
MTKPFVTSLLLLACLLLSACEKDWGVDQHGQEITAAHLQGKWLLINYWAEWCGPCRTEIPELNTLAMSEHNLEVLGVNFDELRGEELAEAAEALGIRFRVLSDDPAERLKLSRSEVLPVTYLVDDKGAVRERLIGEQSAAGILAHLERLRGE